MTSRTSYRLTSPYPMKKSTSAAFFLRKLLVCILVAPPAEVFSITFLFHTRSRTLDLSISIAQARVSRTFPIGSCSGSRHRSRAFPFFSSSCTACRRRSPSLPRPPPRPGVLWGRLEQQRGRRRRQ
ncbi:Os06g0418151 [Oryza sativa Japonica Group]|uniref:Os06g0418151 protein n=1 Tax=Oryza sativa subsp. japonica TaxID=39947 RepID=A0A0P0WWG5_ORYSJ|nr:hypothetical protein EE612_034060 [Oryza sativa]BAS97728.1 Os06g0418151 [Oryza sativa Japonica Group]